MTANTPKFCSHCTNLLTETIAGFVCGNVICSGPSNYKHSAPYVPDQRPRYEIPGKRKYFTPEVQNAYEEGLKHGQLIAKIVHQDYPIGCPVQTTGKTFFKGEVIGHYLTNAGRDGVVIEIEPSPSARGIVHVYPIEHITKAK